MKVRNADGFGASGLLASNQAFTAPTGHRITYLSGPKPVSMGNWWFDIANGDHFWIRRRFSVMKRVADLALRNCRSAVEIGCGNGLLQKQIEDTYGKPVAGFELNQVALEKNVSRFSPLYYYDVNQRNPEFRARFDLVLLFDVLEHIEDEAKFLQSVGFHLDDSGTLLINVPAHSFLRSDYDVAQGHFRRYSIRQLENVCEHNGFKMQGSTYWGLPLVPFLLLRKAMSMDPSDGRPGFEVPGRAVNAALSLLAKFELLPQTLMGTSVMAALKKSR